MEDVVVCALDFDQPLPGLLLLAAVAACRRRCHQLGGWAQMQRFRSTTRPSTGQKDAVWEATKKARR